MRSFNTFNSYIKSGNYKAASQDLYGTLWCRQVGSRCTRDANLIAAGCNSYEAAPAAITNCGSSRYAVFRALQC